MAFVPALLPAGMLAAKGYRNSMPDEQNTTAALGATRKRSVIERLTTGHTPPIAYWSEQQLERMIKTNSVFREHADELRAARTGKKLNGDNNGSKTAKLVEEEPEEAMGA